jgi:hypothetical protein
VFDPSGNWYLRNDNSAGPASAVFPFGLGSWTPVTGDWNFPHLAQRAGGGSGAGAPPIDDADLHTTVQAALAEVAASGASPALLARLGSAQYTLAMLPGAYLGLADPLANQVYIDAAGAGYGWFVDATPWKDEEFAGGRALANGPAAGKMDLLTVVLHEMGHLAGKDDQTDGNGLMAESLFPGTRRTDALDSVFGALAAGT